MTVMPLEADAPVVPQAESVPQEFLAALDRAGAVFAKADRAEAAFLQGRGGLQEMVVARAHADVAIAIATAAATRAVQALGQIFSMPV
jgi:flagellar hook-basal body complex protein FliE